MDHEDDGDDLKWKMMSQLLLSLKMEEECQAISDFLVVVVDAKTFAVELKTRLKMKGKRH